MKRTLLFVPLLCLGLFACNKNDGENQNLNPGNQSTFDFMSDKQGSSWKYGLRDGISFTRYARSKDSVLLGATYHYYERQEAGTTSFTPEYFGKNGTSYITLIDLDGSQANYINYIFWKDGAAQGTTWDNTGQVSSPVGNITVRLESEITQTGLTMTFSNHTYTNAVHIHCDAKAGLFSTNIGTLDFWVVKGIGVIREEADIDVLGQYQMQHTDSLIDYTIAP